MDTVKATPTRKAYSPPQLREYGEMREITRSAGSMSNMLDGATTGNRKTY